MDWLINLFTTTDSIAHVVLLYSIVIAADNCLKKVKKKKIFILVIIFKYRIFAPLIKYNYGLVNQFIYNDG